MKWNFECCRREGDYLQHRAQLRPNDFCDGPINTVRDAAPDALQLSIRRDHAQHILRNQSAANVSLRALLSIETAISLTVIVAIVESVTL
jgi:hypothetical protein